MSHSIERVQPLSITNPTYHAELHLPSPVLCLPDPSSPRNYTDLMFRLTRTATGRPLTWTDLALISERRLHVVIVRSDDLTAMGHVHIVGEMAKNGTGSFRATANAANGLYVTRWRFLKAPGTYSILITYSPLEQASDEKLPHVHHRKSVSATFSVLASYCTAENGTLESRRPLRQEMSWNVPPISDTYRHHGEAEAAVDGESIEPDLTASAEIEKRPERERAVYETQLTILESSPEKEVARYRSQSNLKIETCYIFFLNYSRYDSSSLNRKFIPLTRLQPYLGHAAHVTVARKVEQPGIDDLMMHLHAVPATFDKRPLEDVFRTCEEMLEIVKDRRKESMGNQTYFGPVLALTAEFKRPGIYRLFAESRHYEAADGRVEMLVPAFTVHVGSSLYNESRMTPYVALAAAAAGALAGALFAFAVLAYLRRREEGMRYRKLENRNTRFDDDVVLLGEQVL